MPRLATVCQRAGIAPSQANESWLKAAPLPPERPWAKEVQTEGGRVVVGQGRHEDYFVVFPCPFSGHSDDWKVVLPIDNADDLLKQLKGDSG